MCRGCRALSLIKGIEFEEGGPILISNMIKDAMNGMDVSVLMGANVANEGRRIHIHTLHLLVGVLRASHTPLWLCGVACCGARARVLASFALGWRLRVCGGCCGGSGGTKRVGQKPTNGTVCARAPVRSRAR